MKDVIYQRIIDFKQRTVYVIPIYRNKWGYWSCLCGREYKF